LKKQNASGGHIGKKSSKGKEGEAKRRDHKGKELGGHQYRGGK